ncbi:MAG: carbamoyl phosphate synthase small subunit, partial [Clostridia bacterium]|nr:carbamoyl phosphate synthase small subunit [Clostridia bacterium]
MFTTSVNGFLETLSDPSYYGQAVVQTFPLSGNYGFISSDLESNRCHLSAYIVRSVCDMPSNFRCEGEIDAFLKSEEIPGICGIDTRALASMIRENGTLKGMITYQDPTPNAERLAEKIKEYEIINAVNSVTCNEKTERKQNGNAKTVALYDFGMVKSLENALFDFGFNV